MRKLIVLLTIAILAFGASPVLAITLQDTFQVTGHLGVAVSAGRCTSLAYPAMCPSADTCVCYTATKTSLHSATGGVLTIPPGTTKVAVSVDTKDATSHPGCRPAWGEIQYNQTGGGDNATIEFFASLCKPLTAGAPQTFSGGGALTNASPSSGRNTIQWYHRTRNRNRNIFSGGEWRQLHFEFDRGYRALRDCSDCALAVQRASRSTTTGPIGPAR